MKDTISPDRLVYGVPVGGAGVHATVLLNEVYASALAADTPLIVTDYATAEPVKVAANAFLATKFSFINSMSEIADVSGANVAELADAIGCLPKDIRAFTARAEELGRGDSVAFLKEVDTFNLRKRQRVVAMTVQALGKPVYRSKVAVLGHASSRTPTT